MTLTDGMMSGARSPYKSMRGGYHENINTTFNGTIGKVAAGCATDQEARQ